MVMMMVVVVLYYFFFVYDYIRIEGGSDDTNKVRDEETATNKKQTTKDNENLCKRKQTTKIRTTQNCVYFN